MSDAGKRGSRDIPADAGTIWPTVESVVERQQAKAARPARNEQLALIRPPWNALPGEMSPEERRWILTGDFADRNPKHRAALQRLQSDFPYLPLDKHEFKQALAKALQWSVLVRSSESTFRLHRETVERQLAFPTFDDVITGRVAIFRTANELNLTHPGFSQRKEPTLADIDHLHQRYSDYLRARADAINLLWPLVFLRELHGQPDLPLEERAIGLPNPPENFPKSYLHRAFGWLRKVLPRAA